MKGKKNKVKKVTEHLNKDIAESKKSISEDKKLKKEISKNKKK